MQIAYKTSDSLDYNGFGVFMTNSSLPADLFVMAVKCRSFYNFCVKYKGFTRAAYHELNNNNNYNNNNNMYCIQTRTEYYVV